jgi:hypothetical protein
MNRILIALLLPLLVSSCGFFSRKEPPPPEVVIKQTVVPIEIYRPPAPEPLKLEDIRWFAITRENMEEKLREISLLEGTEGDGNVAIFAITPSTYENLSFNVQELRRYLLEQRAIIEYYENAVQDMERRQSTSAEVVDNQ